MTGDMSKHVDLARMDVLRLGKRPRAFYRNGKEEKLLHAFEPLRNGDYF